jgi:hypothetical protein
MTREEARATTSDKRDMNQIPTKPENSELWSARNLPGTSRLTAALREKGQSLYRRFWQATRVGLSRNDPSWPIVVWVIAVI